MRSLNKENENIQIPKIYNKFPFENSRFSSTKPKNWDILHEINDFSGLRADF